MAENVEAQPAGAAVETFTTPVEEVCFSWSDEIGKIAGALAKAQGSMYNGQKTKQAHNYKYMELGQLLDISRPALSENSIALIQSNQLMVRVQGPTVIVHTMLVHESGQWFKSDLEIPLPKMDNLNTAQRIGVASTYGRRYSVQAMCMVCAEQDTDANSPREDDGSEATTAPGNIQVTVTN